MDDVEILYRELSDSFFSYILSPGEELRIVHIVIVCAVVFQHGTYKYNALAWVFIQVMIHDSSVS